jgi:hypothetical protein
MPSVLLLSGTRFIKFPVVGIFKDALLKFFLESVLTGFCIILAFVAHDGGYLFERIVFHV